MSLGDAVFLIRSGVQEIIIVAGPVLLVGMGVGLVVSILQATTSIQEQTLTFVPKIIAILSTLALLGPWMFTRLAEFTRTIFGMISTMGGG